MGVCGQGPCQIWLSVKEENSKIASFLSTEVLIGANSKVQIDSVYHQRVTDNKVTG